MCVCVCVCLCVCVCVCVCVRARVQAAHADFIQTAAQRARLAELMGDAAEGLVDARHVPFEAEVVAERARDTGGGGGGDGDGDGDGDGGGVHARARGGSGAGAEDDFEGAGRRLDVEVVQERAQEREQQQHQMEAPRSRQARAWLGGVRSSAPWALAALAVLGGGAAAAPFWRMRELRPPGVHMTMPLPGCVLACANHTPVSVPAGARVCSVYFAVEAFDARGAPAVLAAVTLAEAATLAWACGGGAGAPSELFAVVRVADGARVAASPGVRALGPLPPVDLAARAALRFVGTDMWLPAAEVGALRALLAGVPAVDRRAWFRAVARLRRLDAADWDATPLRALMQAT